MFYSVNVKFVGGSGAAKLTISFRMSMPFIPTCDARSLRISAPLTEVRPADWHWNFRAREEAGDDSCFLSILS